MDNQFGHNYDYSLSNISNNITTYIKNNMTTILIMVIIITTVYYINSLNGNYNLIKILKNKYTKIIIVLLLLIYTFKYWHVNKISVIVLLVFVCGLFYVINDDVTSTETFTNYIRENNINDQSYKSIPNFTLNSQPKYKTIGCTHLQLNGECVESDKDNFLMDTNSPQIDNIIQANDDMQQTIGADLNDDGNDKGIYNQMTTFGNAFNTPDPKMMIPLNGNNFLKENARQTLIQNRGKIDKIFDARDFTIQTNNGVKKLNGVENQDVCHSPLCQRPEIQGSQLL